MPHIELTDHRLQATIADIGLNRIQYIRGRIQYEKMASSKLVK
jgi:hypothetical protein